MINLVGRIRFLRVGDPLQLACLSQAVRLGLAHVRYASDYSPAHGIIAGPVLALHQEVCGVSILVETQDAFTPTNG